VYVHDGEGGAGDPGGVGVGDGGVGASAADCVTMNSRSAIVIDPDLVPCELGATRNSTEPLPSPLGGGVTVIHETLLRAVHEQP
jgi:hypothetical protein